MDKTKAEVLTISVVLFKNEPTHITQLCACLSSEDIDMQVYFIDNSPDKSLSFIVSNYSDFKYIWVGDNIGFGKGHNIILNKVMDFGAIHLCLNPDVYFEKGVLSNLLKVMQRRSDVGLLLPRVLNPDNSDQPLYKLLPNPLQLILRRFMPKPAKIVFSKYMSRYELAGVSPDLVFEAPYLSGCFMLLRKDALKEVGCFDERFFLYFEDVDLSRRINEKWSTLYYGEESIYHFFQRGSYDSIDLLMHHIKSAIKYFNKYGWFFDKRRMVVNNSTINQLKLSETIR
ncbi:glycosyltransferase family protein [Roseivirga pacifica]